MPRHHTNDDEKKDDEKEPDYQDDVRGPIVWREAFDEKLQRRYFYHTTTHEIRYRTPLQLATPQQRVAILKHRARQRAFFTAMESNLHDRMTETYYTRDGGRNLLRLQPRGADILESNAFSGGMSYDRGSLSYGYLSDNSSTNASPRDTGGASAAADAKSSCGSGTDHDGRERGRAFSSGSAPTPGYDGSDRYDRGRSFSFSPASDGQPDPSLSAEDKAVRYVESRPWHLSLYLTLSHSV